MLLYLCDFFISTSVVHIVDDNSALAWLGKVTFRSPKAVKHLEFRPCTD